MFLQVFFSVVLSIFLVAGVVALGQKAFNILQLNAYNNKHTLQYFSKFSNKFTKTYFWFFVTSVLSIAIFEILRFILEFNFNYFYILAGLITIGAGVLFGIQKKEPTKKPLIYTARVKRLLTCFIVVNLILIITTNILYFYGNIPFINLAFIPVLLVPINACFANLVAMPIEKLIRLNYIKRAKEKLKLHPNLKVVGITGSYGKTSVKFIITAILKEKYFTLCTPSSFNTEMGITRTVLGELKPHHEIFVVEMGADRPNDIERLCKIIAPDVGVLTAIGPQHLNTMKTLDNIIKTKYQIIENVKPGGLGVFNVGNEHVSKLFFLNTQNKVGVSINGDGNAKIYAKDIKTTAQGQEFYIVTPESKFKVVTKLLGEHNIINILLSVAVALEFNVDVNKIKAAIKKLEPVKHRLELLPTHNGALLLDDSFNSNPMGSKYALDVLKEFKDKFKIVITPGMVELGAVQFTENFNFGKNIGSVADEVYIINQLNKEAIYNGLVVSGFDKNKIYFYNTFNEAFEDIKLKLDNNHVVLIENDLPDNYN